MKHKARALPCMPSKTSTVMPMSKARLQHEQQLESPLACAGLDELLYVIDVSARKGNHTVARLHIQVATLQALCLY